MGTRHAWALAMMAQQHEVVHVIYCQSLTSYFFSNSAFSNSSRIRCCTSVIVPCISQPAAYLWPPPPNLLAMLFTLKPLRLRRLILIQLGSVISRSNTPTTTQSIDIGMSANSCASIGFIPVSPSIFLVSHIVAILLPA